MGWGQCCSQIDENATDGTGPGCSRGGQCRTDSYYRQDAELFASWGVDCKYTSNLQLLVR